MGIRRSSKIKVISIVLFLSVLIMLISCQKKKTGWEGKIEYKKGVKVINNPVEPLCGQIQFEFAYSGRKRSAIPIHSGH